jgi:DNA mismatch repair protein MutS
VTFTSLLFADSPRPDEVAATQPPHFTDLALDRVVSGATAGRGQHDLTALWYLPLHDRNLITYRQEVFADLADPAVRAPLDSFAAAAADVGRQLSPHRRATTTWQARRWVVNAAATYCDMVAALAADLPAARPRARALVDLSEWLAGYITDTAFTALRSDTDALLRRLDAIRYNILLRGVKVTVEAFDDEPDLTEQVTATFARFRQAPNRDYLSTLPNAYLDPVTAQISYLVARLFPDEHQELERYAERYTHFVDPTVALLARELQFYLGYLDYLRPLQRAELPTTQATLGRPGQLEVSAGYDVALAASLVDERRPVVTNDVALHGRERILVVSGPNQGGKTTLARTIGQLHYLAALGCPVPGRAVTVAVTDGIYTHFERQEDPRAGTGKLEADLLRIRDILDRASADSLIILNEIFSSTTLADARALSREILIRVSDLDAVCVCVSFIDELSTLNDKTVSVVATVDDNDPAIRTLKLVRRPADGRAYALALARKYRLTYDQLLDGAPPESDAHIAAPHPPVTTIASARS